jgi:predicted transcriptional regulator
MASVVQVQIYQYLAKHQGAPLTVHEISSAVGRSMATTHKTLETVLLLFAI